MNLARAWYESLPERLDRELDDLADAGATWQIDEEARCSGLLRLNPIWWPWGDQRLRLVAEYPDCYPYFRPEVRAPELKLPHHQIPGVGNLCLINRDTRHWNVNDTLATFLSSRLPMLIRTATTDDPQEAAALEEHQGEPVSDYLPYHGWTMLLVDGGWEVPAEEASGELLIALDPKVNIAHGGLRGAVLEVRGADGRVLCRASDALGRLFVARLPARWARIAVMPVATEPEDIFRQIAATTPAARFGPLRTVGASRLAVLGLVFPEELGYRKIGDSWVFALEWGP
jgi:hypothetical protein